MAGPDTPTQMQIDDKAKQVKLKSKADLDRWLRDTLHPADNTTLHVHFIDYDTPRDLTELYKALDDDARKKPSVDSLSTSSNVDKLVKDIRALCLFTDGVLLSWSGRKMTLGNDDGESRLAIANAIATSGRDDGESPVATANPIATSGRVDGKSPQGTANTTATSGKDDGKSPQHIDLDKMFSRLMKDDTGQDFRDGRSAVVTLRYVLQEGGTPCTHQLVLTSDDTNLMQDTRQTLLTTSVKKGDTRPVVCVLVGGDTQSLKTAVTAVSNNIPVIVMKGSGGFADLLAWLYEKAKLDYRRQREAKKVKTVTRRVVDDDTMDVITAVFEDKPDIMESLATLIKHLHLLTVYNPWDIPRSQDRTTQAKGNMDAAILEALIRHNQVYKIEKFLMTMKGRQKLVYAPPSTYSQTVVENETLQLDCFIDCLLSRSPAAVSAFLSHLKPNFFDFHLARLLRLYEADVCFLRYHKLTIEDRDKPFAIFLQARRDLKSYIGSVSRFPLRCPGVECRDCSLGDRAYPELAKPHFLAICQDPMQESKAHFLQTCLHPVQELFLWSLLCGDIDLTVTLWMYCEDKMAAALFARAAFLGMRKFRDAKPNVDVKKELAEYGKRFEDLAVATLKAAYELDEEKTRDLIKKACPWWGWVSVLQLAMLTKCKLFIAQQPCGDQLTLVWDGYLPKYPRDIQDPSDTSCMSRTKDDGARMISRFYTSRKWCFRITLVWQIAFLLLYSYVLLFDLRDIPSPAFIVLMVWVTDTACEEVRQSSLESDVKNYWRQNWNKLDVVSITVFVLGITLVFLPSKPANIVGRVMLAANFSVFSLRFLQRLMVFTELGLLLVMAEKMMMDSVRFMMILLTVMMSYAVTSESVLYPDMKFSWSALYHLPTKAFWQTFGELGLEEIQGDECAKDGLCPSLYGQYLVPVMVALYVIASHVLLLNLLIAQFNATFEKVKSEAEHHQAWQRCQLVLEYERRSPFPPPCNILRTVITSIIQGCAGMYQVHQRFLLYTSRATPPTGGHNRRLGRVQYISPPGPDDVTQDKSKEPLIPIGEEPAGYPFYKRPELQSSAKGKCVTISSLNAMQYFTVELRDTNNVLQSAHSYSVAKGTKQIILWRKDPTLTVTISGTYWRFESGFKENVCEIFRRKFIAGRTFSTDEAITYSDRVQYLKHLQLQKFEDEQALYAQYARSDDTHPDTPAWATQLFGSIDHKIVALNSAGEDTPPAWATRLFGSMEALLRAQYRPSLVPTAQGRPPRELFQRPAVQ